MLFLDFYKAFDSIKHGFIFKTLEKFDFVTCSLEQLKRYMPMVILPLSLNMVPLQDLNCSGEYIRGVPFRHTYLY